MNCQQAKQIIGAYADGELEASAVLEVEQHLESCSACAGAWRNLQSLKKSLKSEAVYFTAPRELRQRIRSQLPSPRSAFPQRPAWNWNWLTTAISGVFAVCLALLLLVTQSRPSAEQELAQEIVSSHVRSLMPGHLMDVVSTDKHTVKPWFNGKLDFSPPVQDFATQGFPLAGGRLDCLAGRNVAALVFQRNKHVINLFVWPAQKGDSKPTPAKPRQGYNLIHWSEGGMVFWSVSDLNQTELMEFANEFGAGKAVNP